MIVHELDVIGIILLATSTGDIIMIILIAVLEQISLNVNHIVLRIRTADLLNGRGNIVAGGRKASVSLIRMIR